MIKTLAVAAALTVRLAGYAVAQQAPPAPRIICLPISCAACRPIITSATIHCAIIRRVPFRHRRRSKLAPGSLSQNATRPARPLERATAT